MTQPTLLSNLSIDISYKDGSLLLECTPARSKEELANLAPRLHHEMVVDSRIRRLRLAGMHYRNLILNLQAEQVPFQDHARDYQNCPTSLQTPITPRPHQSAALQKWGEAQGKGIVVLPTGAGKTVLAVLAMAKVQRSTLIVVPTIDLMNQWYEVLQSFFQVEVGRLGGGEREIKDFTVSTYDSAARCSDLLGAKFGFLVIDECHHLPAPHYQTIAQNCIAPFRLGLTATLERADGGEALIAELLGEVVYRGEIHKMTASVLAPYDVITIPVELTPTEREEYTAARERYLTFVRTKRIRMSAPGGWNQFLFQTSLTATGREAFRAYRTQKKLAQAASAKLEKLWDLLVEHANDATIIFTEDNTMAYKIARTMCLAALTHRTKAKERKQLLELFRAGTLKTLVTSKVLNEGVDVPTARVGIVVSGNATVREHVQRLGRILRHSPGKRAVMYELIAADTNEQDVNQRRRQHNAYERPTQI
ncbi:MAG: DEAD/DEAH box helicase family protein [Zetaproteobacteria bacterium]|nr:DEAD/DEAH box helicase family protein [Zetaproteobacteria bacterium]